MSGLIEDRLIYGHGRRCGKLVVRFNPLPEYSPPIGKGTCPIRRT
jgi:hypothetical protein